PPRSGKFIPTGDVRSGLTGCSSCHDAQSQGGFDGSGAVLLAPVVTLQPLGPCAGAAPDADEDQADGLVQRASPGAGDTGDRHADVGVTAAPDSLGHCLRSGLADRAELSYQMARHSEQL